MRRGLVLWPLIVVASLVAAEIAGRVLSWQPPPETDTGTPRQGLTAKAAGDWTPSQRAVWIDTLPHPYYTVINDAGFRNVENLDPDAIHLLALGDSFTFGLTVGNHDTWIDVAEKLLRRETGTRLQILNNGIPGTTIVDHLAYLREKGPAVRPDYVLLVIHSNDATDLRREATSMGFSRAFEIGARDSVFLGGLRWWLRQHSGLYALARRAKEGFMVARYARERVDAGIPLNARPGAAARGGATAEEFARHTALLADAVRACRDIGARPVIVHLPAPGSPDTEFVAALRGLTTDERIDMIELGPAYAGQDPELLTWSRDPALDPGYEGDSHLTRMGNLLVGRAFAKAFLPVLESARGGNP